MVTFSLQYYLKARFHFNKDQFADLMVITGIAGTLSQVFLTLFSFSFYDILCHLFRVGRMYILISFLLI